MASEQVQKLAEDVEKLSPAGQAIVSAALGDSEPLSAFLDLHGLIKNHVAGAEKLKQEIRTTREMYEDSFNNNPTYREHAEKVKDASRAKASVKLEIRKQPSVANLEQRLKDLKFDLREKNKTLSDLLIDYKENSGATQLELFDGQMYDIVPSAKLIRAK